MSEAGVPYLNPEEFPKVPFVTDSISSRFIRENKVIPLELKNNILKVLMADPSDMELIDTLRVAVGSEVIVYRGDPRMIDEHISKFYGQESQNLNRIIEGSKHIQPACMLLLCMPQRRC